MAQYLTYPIIGNQDNSETTAAILLNVSATGSDNLGDGSISNPYLTIQKAVDQLPRFINHEVVISVGAGTFAGFVVDGFLFKSIKDAGGSLTIRGTLQLATLASGLNTGTIVSATAGTTSTTTWGTFSVTGAGWTTDDLRGRLVQIMVGTGAGQIRAIRNNTNANPGVATIVGAWTAPTGATFQIVESATVINAVPLGVAGATYAAFINGNEGGDITLGTNGSKCAVTIERLRFTTVANAIRIMGGAPVRFQNNEFRATTVNMFFTGGAGGRAITLDNTFSTNGTGISISEGWAILCVRDGHSSRTGIITNNDVANNESNVAVISDCHFWNPLDFGIRFAVGSGQAVGCILERSSVGATGIDCGDTSPGCVKIFGCSVTNFTTAVTCAGPTSRFVQFQNAITGTGNTTGIRMTAGSQCKVSSLVTLTGTTELSIDGSTQTLATMRAQTPKILRDTNYGTAVYE